MVYKEWNKIIVFHPIYLVDDPIHHVIVTSVIPVEAFRAGKSVM